MIKHFTNDEKLNIFFFLYFSFISSAQENRFESWYVHVEPGIQAFLVSSEAENIRNAELNLPVFFANVMLENGGSLLLGIFSENSLYPDYNGGEIEINISFRTGSGEFTTKLDDEFWTLKNSSIGPYGEGYAIFFDLNNEKALDLMYDIMKFSCRSGVKGSRCSSLYIQTIYNKDSKVFRFSSLGYEEAFKFLKAWYQDNIDPFQEDKKPLGG